MCEYKCEINVVHHVSMDKDKQQEYKKVPQLKELCQKVLNSKVNVPKVPQNFKPR